MLTWDGDVRDPKAAPDVRLQLNAILRAIEEAWGVYLDRLARAVMTLMGTGLCIIHGIASIASATCEW